MGKREAWICRPEGRQRNCILREHRGYNEPAENRLPFASISAGRQRDRKNKQFSCFLVSSTDSLISTDMETLCRIWQKRLGHNTWRRPRDCLYRCDG